VRTVAVDFETHAMTSTNPCPTPVCLAVAKPSGWRKLYTRKEARAILRRLLADRGVRVVGANIPYDALVSMKDDPSLISLWFQAMEEGRLGDVKIKEGLDQLATTGDVPERVEGLASLALKHVGIRVSKGEDTWRKRYGELAKVPLAEWPKEAVDYPLQDADLTCQVDLHIKDRRPEWLHVNSAICYYMMTVRGLNVDVKAKERLQAKVEAALHPSKMPLLYAKDKARKIPALITAAIPERPGLNRKHTTECKRKGGCDCPRVMLKAQKAKMARNEVLIPRIVRACKAAGIKVPRNDPTEAEVRRAKDEGRDPVGSIKTDEDTLKLVAGFDPVLAQLIEHKKLDKLRTAYFPAMEWPFGSGITAPKVFPGWSYLKKTGRGGGRGNSQRNATGPKATAIYPSVAIQLADPRVRGCYVPTKGYVFAVADFSAIDLNCLAQTIKDLYGSSTLLDQINAGIDPHTFLACVLAFENDRKFRREIEGLSEDKAYAAFLRKKTTDPKFFKDWRDLAKKVGLGFAGGMGINTMIGLCRREIRLTLTKAQAKAYRNIWFRVYPEMRWYLQKWVPAQALNSQDWKSHRYTSPMGMRRARCSYTECANGRALQSPAAEGMKYAMWLVSRACYDPTGLDGSGPDVLYGCYPVINMHDELVLEVPISTRRKMDRQARRLEALMIQGMKKVLPDVDVKAKPYLTTRWVKEAEQVLDEDGLIKVWTPGEENDG
jgi:hypothetical protein